MNELTKKAAAIKLLILDVDGVLTDGRLQFDNNGIETKTFNALDGHGIKLLIQHGVDVAIITGRSSQVVQNRAAELGISTLYQGYRDKRSAFNEILSSSNLELYNFAYMGDDLPDLPIMKRVGLSISVPNGDSFVQQHADHITDKPGGYGAVREVCNLILDAQDKLSAIQQAHLQ